MTTHREPVETLKQCQAAVFKGYLHWRIVNSRVRKESSVVTYWKVLSMLYCDTAAAWMYGGVMYDVGNVRVTQTTCLSLN
jgi:hypothetical protein